MDISKMVRNHCIAKKSSVVGTGGLLAEALASQTSADATSSGLHTTTFSLAGNNVWAQGAFVMPSILDGGAGNVRLEEYGLLRQRVLKNLTTQTFSNIYVERYTRSVLDSVIASETLGGFLERVTLQTKYDNSRTQLSKDLYQVSRVIATHQARGAERDFFYVQAWKWDHHSEQLAGLDENFKEVNDGLLGFVAEMEAQNIWESVVVVSDSDFGRSLASNGGGSDHGWAGQQFILGGSVKGQQILNEYPTDILLGNPMDDGRCRMIPKYPRESLMVPVAQWMGLTEDNQATVFPNLANFNSSLIIPYESLFN